MLNDLGILLLRVSAGGMMFLFHGWDKIAHYSEKAASFPDPLGVGAGVSLGLAAFAEGICSVFVILGLATRFASLSLLITMLTAGVMVHAADPWNVKEPAMLYAVCFAVLILFGAGEISLDRIISSRRRKSIFA